MASTRRNHESAIRVAQISSKSAILVAIITTVGGVLSGYLLRGPLEESPAAHSRWLTIERLESRDILDVRLVISVNGLRYSYPSSTVWQAIEPGMQPNKERFLLPSADSYRISFLVFSEALEMREKPGTDTALFSRGGGQATSTTVDEISVAQLPSGVRSYDVFGMVRPFTRAPMPDKATSIRVLYSIE